MTTTARTTMNKYIITLNLEMVGENKQDALNNLKKVIQNGSTTTKEGKWIGLSLEKFNTAEVKQKHE